MPSKRIDHYLNTLLDFLSKGSSDSRPRKLTVCLSVAILIVTVYFGTKPFNFISRNDLEFASKTNGLSFNQSSIEGESSQRAIAYTLDSLSLAENQPISILLELTPTRKPDGLGTLIQLHDAGTQPPLIVAQWQSHLTVRSRRSASSSNRPYREIGLRDCLENGETVSLLISSSETDAFIYVNGVLAERTPGFTLIDPDASNTAQIVLGSSASGEQYWIGEMNRLAIFDQQVNPQEIRSGSIYPLIEYSFQNSKDTTIPNLRSEAFALQTPFRFKPIQLKRFAPLSDWDPNRSGQYQDTILNLFGFIPIGLVFFLFIGRELNNRTLQFIGVVLACFILSFAIEYAQIYLPSRSPSHLDLLGNSLGGCIAAIIGIRLKIEGDKRSQSIGN